MELGICIIMSTIRLIGSSNGMFNFKLNSYESFFSRYVVIGVYRPRF